MKTQIISKSAFVLFAFMFITSSISVFGQRGRNVAKNQRGTLMMCVNQLPDLTPEQTKEITELIQAHQNEMQTLRTERRSTVVLAQKDEIRAEMDVLVKNHRDEVKALLSDEQKAVYENLNSNFMYGNNGMVAANSCRGNNLAVKGNCFNRRGNASMCGNRNGGGNRGYGRR